MRDDVRLRSSQEVRLRAIRFASYTALRCRAATVQRALEPSVGRRVPRRLDQWLDCSREKSCWWVEPHKQKSNTSKGTWGRRATANNWPQLQRGWTLPSRRRCLGRRCRCARAARLATSRTWHGGKRNLRWSTVVVSSNHRARDR